MDSEYKEIRPFRKEGVQETEIDQELILSDPDTGKIHILNETSKLIWLLADGRHTVNEIENEIRQRFSSINDHNIVKDIERFIEELKQKELLS